MFAISYSKIGDDEIEPDGELSAEHASDDDALKFRSSENLYV